MDKSTSSNPALPTNPREELPNPLYQEVVALGQQVDALEFAIGGALFQTEVEHLQPLAFFSRKLFETEKGYSAYDRVACRVCFD
ncbi:hypothetical protein TNIN_313841 [Trichonephila inaurata madagascariensis]|uniref:Reverse transcriptase/retrotransposon-derived protein RNase H-like domain-containing protein n=1 Tax=Trichonephila inaurata madagascariensis TaxID=2747483 RepID=A0A8X6XV85_9ARAC|nr:hypothetical protein TNIN_313841 [Trichonephila inaurata madagascariensis]